MMEGILLCLLLTSVTGVCAQTPDEIYVKGGELVALYCPDSSRSDHKDPKVSWRSSSQEKDLTNMSPAEQRQMDMLIHGRSLVILSASVHHQGNYSCTLGNASNQFWFRLFIYTTQSKEDEKSSQYPQTCNTPEACRLYCPDVNVPDDNIPNITMNSIIWSKEGDSIPKDGYFSSVAESDHGVYTCTRSYLYYDQLYNMTFKVDLDVQPKEEAHKMSAITSPHKSDVFYVDLGSTVVIDCKAVMYSVIDDVFWFSDKSAVKTNNSYPVFYNVTREYIDKEIKMTVSLVFKKVSEEDLSKSYTCKLEPVSGLASFVTITLAQKPRPSYVSLGLGTGCVLVAMVLIVVIYVRFKVNITLFLRDTLGCHSRRSDGKSYDVFLMCYKSDTDAGLNQDDRKLLESILEEKFGYTLCLYDRDVLPGKAVAEAVLDCVDQSRTVVLVPTSPDLGPGSGLLSAIHAALVERQTRLVFIQTEKSDVSRCGSMPEALQLLAAAGRRVMWKGVSSKPPSSSFWKQLRYYLPAPLQTPKIQLLPQTV